MSELQISKYYNISVFANSILGSNFRNVKLSSVLDYQTALKFGSIDLLHKQIYPYLPPDTPVDNTKYTYYLFQVRGKQIVLADYWIVPGSIVETEGAEYTFKLKNVTSHQVAIVRDQLRLLGIQFEIS